MFSLLLSPSSRVTVVLMRFGLGVEPGVGRKTPSSLKEVAVDDDDDLASDEAWRFPNNELRVCIIIRL